MLGIFIDFSKAFDLLNRTLPFQKLQHYGIRGTALEIMTTYFAQRNQYVSINNHASITKPALYGVPQGSILGPYLFNIYINDIVRIDQSVKFFMYADDTSLFLSDSDCKKLLERGNEILVKLAAWSSANGLSINTEKTKAVSF